jgi:hypothetical protein
LRWLFLSKKKIQEEFSIFETYAGSFETRDVGFVAPPPR